MNVVQIFVVSAGIAVSVQASGQDSPRFVEELIASCCDRLSVLYDAEGEVIRRPDGGFSGEGDGKCPDFVALPSKGVLLWRDAEQEEPLENPAAEWQ